MPNGLPALVVHVDEAIQNRRRREGQRGVVVVELSQLVAVAVDVVLGHVCLQPFDVVFMVPVVPVFHELVEVFDLVHAQRGVGLQCQPRQRCPRGRELNTQAVAVLHIGGEWFADVAHGTRLYQLVVVGHVVAVQARAPRLCRELIAQLVVQEALGLRCGVVAVVGEVVALGLTMAHGYRSVDAVSVLMERETCLWVQEVVLLVDVEVMFLVEVGLLVIDELVVIAVGIIADVTILHVGKHITMRGDVVESLHEDVAVELLRIGVVVLVVAVLHEQSAQLLVA